MPTVSQIHIALEIWGCIFSVLAASIIYISRKIYTKSSKYLFWIFIANSVLLLCDSCAWMFRGDSGALGFYMVRISNFLVFALGYVLINFFMQYVGIFIEKKRRCYKYITAAVKTVSTLGLLILIISQYTHWYYYFDENNFYHRNILFPISQFSGIVNIGLMYALIISHRKYISRENFISFCTYITLPVAALIIQLWVYGIAFLNIANTISVMMLFFSSQINQAKLLVEKESELTDAKISVMMSQIQPHFLYNSLAAIRGLCTENPKKARTAIEDFSFFLRGNMESITNKGLIPFKKELAHVKNYAALELVRFEDRLNIEYNITCTDFQIPPLTVQPIVENAVKYGILGHDDITRVQISTSEDESNFYVTVEDSGVGFNAEEEKNDGKSHVGIKNVRRRLEMMCGGSLIIESRIGKGTIAMIAVPKN